MTQQEWLSLNVTLTTLEPIHIGGSSNPLAGVDNPIVFLNGDIPAIPGTTLKGALRSEIERYLIKLLQDNMQLDHGEKLGLKPCIPTPPNLLSEDEEKAFSTNHFYKRKKDLHKEGAYIFDPCNYDRNSNYICPACYLLGAQTLHGFVRIPFLLPKEGQSELDTLLYSIRQDRAKGGAANRSNRGWSVINPGIEFTGVIEILKKDHLTGWEFGKKRAMLKYNRVDKWLDDPTWTVDKIKQELIIQRFEAINAAGGYFWKGCGKVQIRIEEQQADTQETS